MPSYCEGAYWSDEPARLERSRLCGTPAFPWEPCPGGPIPVSERFGQGPHLCNWSAVGTFPKGAVPKWSAERGCYWECPPGTRFQNYITGPTCFREFRDKFDAGEFFSELGQNALATAAIVAAPALGGPLAVASQTASQFATGLQAGGVLPMSLNIGGILQGISGLAGGLSGGNYLQALSGGLGAAASFFPQPSAQPVMYPQPMNPFPQIPQYPMPAPIQAQPVGAFSVPAAAAARLGAITAPILAKIAVKLGLRARPSLTRAMEIIRKGAKLLNSPEAVAVALGISVAELATLITANSARKRRRMNPANSKALRRAARRIKSFHRLCTHTDVLRSRSRRASKMACGTCRKSPCRC